MSFVHPLESADSVLSIGRRRRLGSDRLTLLSHDYKRAQALGVDLPLEGAEHDVALAAYDPVGAYAFADADEAGRYAGRMAQAEEARRDGWQGEATARTLRAGTWFRLTQAPGQADSAPEELLITRVRQLGVNNLPTDLRAQIDEHLGPAEALFDGDLASGPDSNTARGAGLKLRSLAEMQASGLWAERYAPSFDVPQETRTALSGYMRHVRKHAGLLREVFEAHMELYWAWIDSGLAIEDANAKREALPRPSRNRPAPGGRPFLTMAHLLRSRARTAEGRGALRFPPVRNAVPAEVEDFFETYVHDSFEHFSMTGGTLQTDLSIADYYELWRILAPRA